MKVVRRKTKKNVYETFFPQIDRRIMISIYFNQSKDILIDRWLLADPGEVEPDTGSTFKKARIRVRPSSK